MLTLLTATGCRPQAWGLCEQWMARQTFDGPVRWVIVDDGEQAQPLSFARPGWELCVVRPRPYWRSGENTQARNLLAGLAVIGDAESVAVIEDDDWYAPDWLATVHEALQTAELVGEGHARYYNLARGVGRQLVNGSHASLCSTAVRGQALKRLRAMCTAHLKFIDIHLWRAGGGRLIGGHRVVGIKGLPGRGGIGAGHRQSFTGTPDHGGRLLREWVGPDADRYLELQDAHA